MTIKLPCFGIVVKVEDDNSGSICSDLTIDDGELDWDVDEVEHGNRRYYNAAVDGIESTILAHARAGIDISSPAYIEGVETAVGIYLRYLKE